MSIAGPMIAINTILADSLDYIATSIESSVADGADFNVAVQKVLEEIISTHGAVVFNGNGYSDEWPIEAEQRGLKNLRTTVDALPELISPEAIELFSRYSVFNEREMHSRYEIGLEQYVLSISVEANLTREIATTTILPAALRYQTELATNVAALRSAGVEADTSTLEAVTGPLSALRAGLASLTEAVGHDHDPDGLTAATYCRDTVLPAMASVRKAADELEGLVADDLWSLPTYQEMLYIL
jgi:glutamine synthetase